MSFYVILPSNSLPSTNKTNLFTIHLPKKLSFNSDWKVGLSVLIYPHSWPPFGAMEERHFIKIIFNINRPTFTYFIPLSQQFKNHSEFESHFQEMLQKSKEEQILKIKTLRDKASSLPERIVHNQQVDLDNQQIFYKNFDKYLNITYNKDLKKFHLKIDRTIIKQVEFSPQLSYMLGFDKVLHIETVSAAFSPDLSGGLSNFYIYAPGLIEPVIVGDTTAPLLRIITIKGKEGEIIEDVFMHIQYYKLLTKEISEIQIEIRTPNGKFLPFQYGNCILTLHFKKEPYF